MRKIGFRQEFRKKFNIQHDEWDYEICSDCGSSTVMTYNPSSIEEYIDFLLEKQIKFLTNKL